MDAVCVELIAQSYMGHIYGHKDALGDIQITLYHAPIYSIDEVFPYSRESSDSLLSVLFLII